MVAFTPGTSLHDRYQLHGPIGAGGMAEVWRATDLVLGRDVAIKVLDGQLARDPSLRAAARREAQAAAALNHPHITAIHDYAELALPDGRVIPYLVLELLHGHTLAERMGTLSRAELAIVAGQVASALTAAHARSVIHQDIKPANIMLTATGAKVLDFGIAAIPGRHDSPDWIAGTPAYVAPERARGAPPDPASDVFSLAAVVYEALTGRLPWPIETWDEAGSLDRRPPPSTPDIPSAVLAALAIDPAARPSADELGHALRAQIAEPTGGAGRGAGIAGAVAGLGAGIAAGLTGRRGGHRPTLADPGLAGASPGGAALPGGAAPAGGALAGGAALSGRAAGGRRDGRGGVEDGATAPLAGPGGPPRPTLIAPAGFAPGSARVPDRPTRIYEAPPPPRPPKRSPHLAAAYTLIILLLVLGSIFFLAAVMQLPSSDRNATPPNSPTAQPTPTVEATPTGSTSDNVNEVFALLRQAVNVALVNGGIDDGEVDNIRQRIDDIVDRYERGRINDMIRRADQLREDIREMQDDGEVNRVTAETLDALLRELIQRAQNL